MLAAFVDMSVAAVLRSVVVLAVRLGVMMVPVMAVMFVVMVVAGVMVMMVVAGGSGPLIDILILALAVIPIVASRRGMPAVERIAVMMDWLVVRAEAVAERTMTVHPVWWPMRMREMKAVMRPVVHKHRSRVHVGRAMRLWHRAFAVHVAHHGLVHHTSDDGPQVSHLETLVIFTADFHHFPAVASRNFLLQVVPLRVDNILDLLRHAFSLLWLVVE